jgi:hypothetical protein
MIRKIVDMKRELIRTFSPKDIFSIAEIQDEEIRAACGSPNVEEDDCEDDENVQYMASSIAKERKGHQQMKAEILHIQAQISAIRENTLTDISSMRQEQEAKKKSLLESHESKMLKLKDQARGGPSQSALLRSCYTELSKLEKESVELKALRDELEVMIAEEEEVQSSLEWESMILTQNVVALTEIILKATKKNEALEDKERMLRGYVIPKVARECSKANRAIMTERKTKQETIHNIREIVGVSGCRSLLQCEDLSTRSGSVLELILEPIIENE